MTATHPTAASSGGRPEDEVKRQVIDELASRLAAITSGGIGAEQPRARGGSGADPTAAGGGGDDDERRGTRRRPHTPEGPVPVGGSGTVGSTHPNRRRGEPAGHSEDDPGDPEAVARAICLRLLTGAARPRAGLAAALRLRGIPDDVADRVLDRFTEVGLIDDKAYAQAFVAAKHRERALGATALRTELRRKGVDEATVSDAVQVIDQDAERERARALIRKRVDAALANGEQAARRRLVALLARRGYAPDVAYAVVSEVLDAHRQETEQSWPIVTDSDV